MQVFSFVIQAVKEYWELIFVIVVTWIVVHYSIASPRKITQETMTKQSFCMFLPKWLGILSAVLSVLILIMGFITVVYGTGGSKTIYFLLFIIFSLTFMVFFMAAIRAYKKRIIVNGDIIEVHYVLRPPKQYRFSEIANNWKFYLDLSPSDVDFILIRLDYTYIFYNRKEKKIAFSFDNTYTGFDFMLERLKEVMGLIP